MRDINQLADKAKKMLDELCIPYSKEARITINKRLKIFGRAIYKKDLIGEEFIVEISEWNMQESTPEKYAINTMLHELIHTCPDCRNHGSQFRYYGNQIYSRYGIKIERTADEEETKMYIEQNPIKYKYICKCEKCGSEWKYQKICDTVRNPNKYKHRDCGGKLIRVQ